MAFTDTASRKLLHGAGGAIARGVAADGIVGMSFGLDGLWQLIAGLFGSAARLLLLPFEALWHLLQTAAAGMCHLLVLPFVALWHLIDGFFAGLLAVLGSAAHGLAEPFEALWQWLQTAAMSISSGFDGLWQYMQGILPNLLAALAGAAHKLVVPFEALWHLLQTAAAGMGHLLVLPFVALWHLIDGVFAGLLAVLGSAAHGLAEPFEALWQRLQTAATSISSGFDGLWQYMQGILPNLLAALAGAAHKLVVPFEAFWRWIQTTVADAAAGISFDLDGFWPLVRRSFANLLTTLATAAHELVPAVEAFWRWLKTAAAVALPILLLIAAVACLVALVWFCWPILCAPAMTALCCLQSAVLEVAGALVHLVYAHAMTALCCLQPAVLGVAGALVHLVYVPAMTALCCLQPAVLGVARALVHLVCCSAHCLHGVAMVVGRALARFFPVCAYCFRCCVNVTMKAPGAAGMVISRAAFVADPRHYFQILRSAGTVVASVVFSTPAVASAVAAPVATLYRA